MNDVVVKSPTLTVNAEEDGVLSTVGDVAVTDVSDVEPGMIVQIILLENDIGGAGTLSVTIETSIDGTNFALLGTADETDFATEEVAAIAITGRGARQVRVTYAASDNASVFTTNVVGAQRLGYR